MANDQVRLSVHEWFITPQLTLTSSLNLIKYTPLKGIPPHVKTPCNVKSLNKHYHFTYLRNYFTRYETMRILNGS